MGFYKKTILLKNTKGDSGMCLLAIERTNSGVFATIKSYDLKETQNMVLGLSLNGEAVTRQNILFSNGDSYTFKLPNDFDIDGKIGAVLVDKGEKVVPIVWGSNNSKSTYKDDIINMFKEKTATQSTEIPRSVRAEERSLPPLEKQYPPQTVIEYTEPETEKTSDNSILYETTPEEIEKLIDDNMDDDDDFYSLIKDQLDDLFARFPHNTTLELLVENSKWVTIDFDGVDRSYVVGLLYDDNGNLTYIAYGVPGNNGIKPPSQIADYSQWLPLDPDLPNGEGYWVMFQDSTTGDSVILKA